MPGSGFEKVVGIARRVKRFLRNPKKVLRRRLWGRKDAARRKSIRRKKHEFRQLKNQIKSNKMELSLLRRDKRAATEQAEGIEHKKWKKRLAQEIFQLQREFGAIKEGRAEGEPVAGALPDFLVIGGKKCGTSFLYHLLTLHPLVQPAATKELHFFDALFDEGIEWYRQCFPAPRWEDGRRTITGEASPYMANRSAPERMAQVIPQVRLIALLRNPVDRAYSDYQMGARKEREHKTFEEAIGVVAESAGSSGKGGGVAPQRGDRFARPGYLSRGIYVDQLSRWTRFFDREQLLVLKSEDFFERPQETLDAAFAFLGLPEWELEASEIKPKKRNTGRYKGKMDPATRRRLEEYFEPHNRRLYEFLGTDLGW